MADRPVVVVADPIDPGALEALRAGPCRLVDVSATPPALPEALADAWGLVVRSRTKVTARLLAAAPHLKLVARAGVGVDNVDLEAAAARGVTVVNSPRAAGPSVAELSIAFYLLLLRELLPQVAATREGRWDRRTRGHELFGRTVGFVGYGRIAREIARRLAPFGARTLGFDPFLSAAVDATPLVPFEELLERSDIVSVHAALTEENRHLLGEAAFARMRPGAYLVNVARGPLVEEKALLAALRTGRLAGAALDVFEVEPPTDRELLADPRVIPTPHLGASTEEAQARAGADLAAEVLRALRGEPLTAAVRVGGGA